MLIETHRSEKLSRENIRLAAYLFRKELGIINDLYIPVEKILDRLPELDSDISYEIVPDNELDKNTEAEADVINKIICIKESVYNKACLGDGRSRMTIAHEIGHIVLVCLCGVKLYRTYKKKEVCEDPEWQAACFAGEFLVGFHLLKADKDLSIDYLVNKCGVTKTAAKYQYNEIMKSRCSQFEL